MVLPVALNLDWRKVMRTGGLIVYGRGRLHQDLAQLLLLMGLAEVVAPQAGLCLERELLGGGIVQVALLAIDKGWKPLILARVDAPAVKMEIVVRPDRAHKSAVESHNVIVVVLHPEAAHKTTLGGLFLRGHVETQTAYFA